MTDPFRSYCFNARRQAEEITGRPSEDADVKREDGASLE